MSRPRLLAAWELGAGLGHITALAGVLERLDSEVEIHAAVRSPEKAESWFPEGTIFHTVPDLHGVGQRPSVTYADVLWGLGWTDSEVLASQVAGWRRIVDAVRPDAVIQDTSPTLLLAMATDPTAVLGFCNPWGCVTDTNPLASFLASQPADESERARREAPVLDAINQVSDAPFDSLAGLYRPTPHFLYGIRETDPWAEYRAEDRVHVGPITHLAGGERMNFPAGQGHRIFAYLKLDYPSLRRVLDGLAQLGRPTLAVVPGHREAQRGRLQITGLPVRFDHLAEQADLVVTHSVLGTGFGFLLSSVPVVLLPMQLEQRAMAEHCSILPGILQLPEPEVEKRFGIVLREALEPAFRIRAADTRRALQIPTDPFGHVAQAVEALL